MAIKRPGAYTPLAANYADDDAIMAAGEDAELMFIRILAYCGRSPKSEGWISDSQIRTRLGIEMRPELGPDLAPETRPEKRAEKLEQVGLLTREGSGYRVTGWLKWNPSRAEMERKRAQDRNAKGSTTSEDTRSDTRNAPRKATRSDTRIGAAFDTAETETETETETGRTSEVADAPPDPHRPEVDKLCNHLADLIAANGSKRPTVTKAWRDACRLMLDRDDRTEDQIRGAIDWSQRDEFWRTNILSMPKLRTKYDQLRLQATRPARAGGQQADTDAHTDRYMTRLAQRQHGDQPTPEIQS